MSPSKQNQSPPPPRKGTLICFDCGHESPVEGDWKIHIVADGVRIECPECGATIESRPRPVAEVVG